MVGMATGLAVFADRAAMVCDPTLCRVLTLRRKSQPCELESSAAAPIWLQALISRANSKSSPSVVVVTDGLPDSCEDALRSAAVLKQKGIEILCIGTDDADKTFLDQLATRKELAMHVGAQNIRTSMGQATQLLLGGSR